jgi:hypothetical protein
MLLGNCAPTDGGGYHGDGGVALGASKRVVISECSDLSSLRIQGVPTPRVGGEYTIARCALCQWKK